MSVTRASVEGNINEYVIKSDIPGFAADMGIHVGRHDDGEREHYIVCITRDAQTHEILRSIGDELFNKGLAKQPIPTPADEQSDCYEVEMSINGKRLGSIQQLEAFQHLVKRMGDLRLCSMPDSLKLHALENTSRERDNSYSYPGH